MRKLERQMGTKLCRKFDGGANTTYKEKNRSCMEASSTRKVDYYRCYWLPLFILVILEGLWESHILVKQILEQSSSL